MPSAPRRQMRASWFGKSGASVASKTTIEPAGPRRACSSKRPAKRAPIGDAVDAEPLARPEIREHERAERGASARAAARGGSTCRCRPQSRTSACRCRRRRCLRCTTPPRAPSSAAHTSVSPTRAARARRSRSCRRTLQPRATRRRVFGRCRGAARRARTRRRPRPCRR